MLYNLLVPFADDFTFLNIFRYLTFRTGGAIMTALFIGLLVGPKLIHWLKQKQGEGQPIRTDGPETHFKKAGTPTMGGLMILISVTVSTLLWASLANPFIWIALVVMVGFGALGFGDDFLKLTKRNAAGLSARKKLLGQAAISLVATAGIVFCLPEEIATKIAIPFFKHYYVPLGIFFFAWSMFVMIGASNAVNEP